MNSVDEKLVGSDVSRQEDLALLTGDAEFTDDATAPNIGHLVFVQNQYGHARVEDIDTAEAAAKDGVYGVFTWKRIADSDSPDVLSVADTQLDADISGHPLLSRNRVQYQGQPIAAVVAETPAIGNDAAAAVDVDYDASTPWLTP